MNLFSQLRQYAQDSPETIAVSSRYRDVTCRKLWSRIERATARLQCEWKVGRGDRVAYLGQAHPDTVVLYLAVARCQAQLVALEDPALRPLAGNILRELDARVLLHEDDLPVEPAGFHGCAHSLSALIGTRCPHEPSFISEDEDKSSLVNVHNAGPGGFRVVAHSLKSLKERMPPVPQSPIVRDRLFDEAVFAEIALPALLSRKTLLFR